LIGGKNEGNVGFDAGPGEGLNGPDSFYRHGNFDDHVFAETRKGFGLADHAWGVLGDDFKADRALAELQDFLYERVELLALFLGHKGGIGSEAVKHTPGSDSFDFFEVGGVEEK